MKICIKFANSIVSGTLDDVNPNDAVGDVIKLIQHDEKFQDATLSAVPVPDYELVTVAGKMLDRGSTLESCGVEDGNILFALEAGPFEISIHPSSSWSFDITVQSTDTVRSLKEKIHIETKKQMEANYIRARAELMAIVGNEENIEMAILPRDKLYWRRWYRRYKAQLPDRGIPPNKQCLTYLRWPLEDDEKCLWYYGIVKPPKPFRKPGCVLLDPNAWKNKMPGDKQSLDPNVALALEAAGASNQIFLEIPSENRIIPFDFRPTDTINDLKVAIHKRGVWFDEKHNHTLVFQKQKLPLDGERTLRDCGIKDRDSVLMYEHMPFVVCVYFPREDVPPESCSFAVKVCLFDTIREVKVKIWKRLAVPVEQQRLRYISTWLVDDSSRLLDYGVVGMQHSYIFFLFTSERSLPADLA